MPICTNIVNKEKTTDIADKVLKILNDSLAKSVGPFGSNTLIQGRDEAPRMTKDGYTILKAIHFNDPIAFTFLNMIRDASVMLVEEVGDGSTSAILAAYRIYTYLKPLINETNIRPKKVLDLLKSIVEDIISELEKMAIPIDETDTEIIKNIASVSLNNDNKVGQIISEIYSNIGIEGFINVKLGNTPNTHYKKTEGFQIDVGFLDKIFANDGTDSVLENSAILMFDSTVTKDQMITILDEFYMGDIISRQINKLTCRDKVYGDEVIKSITVIAPGFDAGAKAAIAKENNHFESRNYKKTYNIIDYAIRDEMDSDIYYDLSAMVGADIIKNSIEEVKVDIELLEKSFGFAKKIVSNKKTTTFFDSAENTSALETSKNIIKDELEEMKFNNIIDLKSSYRLKKRLAIMEKKLVTIYVGGDTEAERLANKDLIDDAVAACKSAFKYGYVIGCNLSIQLAINKILNNTDKDTFEKDLYIAIGSAFADVYKEVLNKSSYDDDTINKILKESIEKEKVYDLVNEEYTDTKVINSVKTEIEILKNVVSIISLIITCNQFIEVNPNTNIDTL